MAQNESELRNDIRRSKGLNEEATKDITNRLAALQGKLKTNGKVSTEEVPQQQTEQSETNQNQ